MLKLSGSYCYAVSLQLPSVYLGNSQSTLRQGSRHSVCSQYQFVYPIWSYKLVKWLITLTLKRLTNMFSRAYGMRAKNTFCIINYRPRKLMHLKYNWVIVGNQKGSKFQKEGKILHVISINP